MHHIKAKKQKLGLSICISSFGALISTWASNFFILTNAECALEAILYNVMCKTVQKCKRYMLEIRPAPGEDIIHSLCICDCFVQMNGCSTKQYADFKTVPSILLNSHIFSGIQFFTSDMNLYIIEEIVK